MKQGLPIDIISTKISNGKSKDMIAAKVPHNRVASTGVPVRG